MSPKKQVILIGFPLKHSISPAMHNAAFAELNLPYEYTLLETPLEQLKEKIKALRNEGFLGANITIPHKEAVIPLLDEMDPLAKSIGAVNTIKNKQGKLIGYNTDATGFITSLKEDARFDPKGKKILILGAGGAARAVAQSLLNTKASSIFISDIIEEKAVSLSKYFNQKIVVKNPSKDLLKDLDLLINASPVGMHPNVDQSPIAGIPIPKNILVYDLVYNPYETKLMQEAKQAGAQVCSGLGMLIRQAAAAFKIFTTQAAPYETMRKAAYQALRIV